MRISCEKITEFAPGTLYKLLVDAYSFDARIRACFDDDWMESDKFFYDNPVIAEKYGFMTVMEGEPIGFISWDPRHIPDYVEIGHNCIATKYKGNGYGKKQLQEAVRRIKEYKQIEKIIVETNRSLIASHNYESVGFQFIEAKENDGKASFMGDYLEYEMKIKRVENDGRRI